jgi:hypothetical protein
MSVLALALDKQLRGTPSTERVCELEALMANLPQLHLQPAVLTHGQVSARAVLIPAGTLLTGCETNLDNLCIVIGDITVTTDAGPKRLTGFHMLPANRGSKRVGHAHADTARERMARLLRLQLPAARLGLHAGMITLTAQEALDRRARPRGLHRDRTPAAILAAQLQGGMTPANARWFGLDVHNADAWKAWLDNAADQLHQEIHNANFDSEASSTAMLDMVSAGWFVMYVDTDREIGGFVFESWPIAQCFVSSSRADGVDTIYRAYTLSAEQLVSEFGEDNVSARPQDGQGSARHHGQHGARDLPARRRQRQDGQEHGLRLVQGRGRHAEAE